MKKMYKKTRVIFLAVLIMLFPLASNAKESDLLYGVLGRDLKSICEKDTQTCKLWIEGAMEGMEFMYTFKDTPKRDKLFCTDTEEDYLDNVYQSFMSFISNKENENMLDQPAIISVAVGFKPYLCWHKKP